MDLNWQELCDLLGFNAIGEGHALRPADTQQEGPIELVQTRKRRFELRAFVAHRRGLKFQIEGFFRDLVVIRASGGMRDIHVPRFGRRYRARASSVPLFFEAVGYDEADEMMQTEALLSVWQAPLERRFARAVKEPKTPLSQLGMVVQRPKDPTALLRAARVLERISKNVVLAGRGQLQTIIRRVSLRGNTRLETDGIIWWDAADIRKRAIDTLRQQPGSEKAQAALHLAILERDPEVRRAALEGVDVDQRAIKLAIHALSWWWVDGNDAFRVGAKTFLRGAGREAELRAVEEAMLGNIEPIREVELREECVHTLMLIVRKTSSSLPLVRAATALGELGVVSALGPIQAALNRVELQPNQREIVQQNLEKLRAVSMLPKASSAGVMKPRLPVPVGADSVIPETLPKPAPDE